MQYIKLRAIFERICDSYNIGNDKKKEEKKQLRTGMISTLKNKFAVLLNIRLARDTADFKSGSSYNSPIVIPECDAPIIYALLRRAVAVDPTEDEKLLSEWLTPTGISPSDYERIHDLHSFVYSILSELEMNDEINDVTREEWIRAIDISIGFDKAITIQKCILQMEDLMAFAAVLDVPGRNEVILEKEDGSRMFFYNPQQYLYDVNTRPVSKIAEGCGSIDELSILFQSVLNSIKNIIMFKVIQTLETIANTKKFSNAEHITEAFKTKETIASGYYTYYNSIYLLLKRNPDLCNEIEQRTGIPNILEYLQIDHSLPEYLKNKPK